MSVILRFFKGIWPRLKLCQRAPVSRATFLTDENGDVITTETGEVITIQ